MSETSPAPVTAPAPAPAELRVGLDRLPSCHGAVATALGEAGLGGQELQVLFATGLKAACVGCGMSLTGEELGKLAVTEGEGSSPLPPKLERLRLGFCPRNGCEARFYQIHRAPLPRPDAAKVLARADEILRGRRRTSVPRLDLGIPSTRRQVRRLAAVALGTVLVCFVAYRLVYFGSQPIPFVKPASPFQADPATIDAPARR